MTVSLRNLVSLLFVVYLNIYFSGARPNIKTDLDKDKTKFGFPASQASSYTVADCRSLVKTLVGGVKTVTCGCAVLRASFSQIPIVCFKQYTYRIWF